jgi:RNA polymerase sigma factor for flagellar operon FliA
MHRALASYASPAGDSDEILRRHGGIVDRVARRLAVRAGNPSLYDDLWSAGALGLLEAAGRFDGERGASFETFAEHRVRGAMMDELRRQDHLPRRLRAQANAVAERRHQLNAELGREPTSEELARACNLAVEELAEMETLPEPHLSLDWIAQCATDPDAEDRLGRAQLQRALADAVAGLPERLRTVLGLIYTEDLTYAEVAQLLDVSKPRVCQLHADAVARLRAALESHRDERD